MRKGDIDGSPSDGACSDPRQAARGGPGGVGCLLSYGTSVHDHQGGEIVVFDKRAFRRLERAIDAALLRRVTDHRSLYAVRSTDGALVTVGHRFRRVRRD